MNGNYDYYRIYISEKQRLELNINYKNRLFFVYLDKENHLIVSRNLIPINFKYQTIKAQIHSDKWTIDFPKSLIQNIDRTLYRYALVPITADKQTCQVVKISPRIFIKEKHNVRITPLSKSRRAKIERIRLRRNSESAKNRKNPNLFDTLQ